jgi:hypothetical protein
VRCCYCERPLGRLTTKCPTCLTTQLWWRVAGAVALLLGLFWLIVFGIPMAAD